MWHPILAGVYCTNNDIDTLKHDKIIVAIGTVRPYFGYVHVHLNYSHAYYVSLLLHTSDGHFESKVANILCVCSCACQLK